MYAIYRELHPPTGVEHCLECHFFDQRSKSLVVASTSLLRVFDVVSLGTKISCSCICDILEKRGVGKRRLLVSPVATCHVEVSLEVYSRHLLQCTVGVHSSKTCAPVQHAALPYSIIPLEHYTSGSI